MSAGSLRPVITAGEGLRAVISDFRWRAGVGNHRATLAAGGPALDALQRAHEDPTPQWISHSTGWKWHLYLRFTSLRGALRYMLWITTFLDVFKIVWS